MEINGDIQEFAGEAGIILTFYGEKRHRATAFVHPCHEHPDGKGGLARTA